MFVFGNSTTYYSSKLEWANNATSSGRIDKLWSQYHQNSDFQWCSFHKRFFIPTDQAPSDGFEKECSVCRRNEPLLNINGASDEKTILGYRVIWQNCKEKLKKIAHQFKESTTANGSKTESVPLLAREEIGCWLQYEISVWNLGQALKQYYFTLQLQGRLSKITNKWKLNEIISNYQSDYLVRNAAVAAPMGTISLRGEKDYNKMDRSLLTTPGLTYCPKHDCIGEGIPFKHPSRYNPDCFTCIQKRVVTEEQKQRDAPVKMTVQKVKNRTTRNGDTDEKVILAQTMGQLLDETIPCKQPRSLRPVAMEYNNYMAKSDKMTRTQIEYMDGQTDFTFNSNSNNNNNMEEDNNIPLQNLNFNSNSSCSSNTKDYRPLPSNRNGGLPVRNTTVKRLAPGKLFL